jgi:hypothetical protein
LICNKHALPDCIQVYFETLFDDLIPTNTVVYVIPLPLNNTGIDYFPMKLKMAYFLGGEKCIPK